MSDEVATRILSRCIPDGDCLIWTGAVGSNGYAKIAVDGRSHPAHRVIYEATVGPIPAGLTIDHLCLVKTCQNVEHMEPVTLAENGRRGSERNPVLLGNLAKTECPQGHAYDAENTYYERDGSRQCRTCKSERVLAWQRANRERHNENVRRYRARKKAIASGH